MLALVLIATACGSPATPASAATTTPTARPSLAHGDPIDPGPKPAHAECRELLAGDPDVAHRIRAAYRIDGLSSTPEAIEAAAANLNADVTTIGVPVTDDELAAVRASGSAIEPLSGLASWIHVGAPDRFGGIWIDVSNRVVVAVLDEHPTELRIARCLAPDDAQFVHARLALANGEAQANRISADWTALAGEGIHLALVAYSEKDGFTTVGVTGLTDDIRLLLQARYGSDLVVVEQAPVVGG